MFKTLKSLSNHPAFGGMERSNARDFIRSNGFKIVVCLKRGFWNARHAVNVVMGNTANEVLAFFNDGSIKAESELNAAERNAIGITATPTTLKSLGTDECLTCGNCTECFDLGAVAPNTEAICGVCYADSIAHGGQYAEEADCELAVQAALGRNLTKDEQAAIMPYYN